MTEHIHKGCVTSFLYFREKTNFIDKRQISTCWRLEVERTDYKREWGNLGGDKPVLYLHFGGGYIIVFGKTHRTVPHDEWLLLHLFFNLVKKRKNSNKHLYKGRVLCVCACACVGVIVNYWEIIGRKVLGFLSTWDVVSTNMEWRLLCMWGWETVLCKIFFWRSDVLANICELSRHSQTKRLVEIK